MAISRIAACLLGCVGCATARPDRDNAVIRRDSAGVEIVDNRLDLDGLPTWTIDSAPLVSIGGGEGDASFVGVSGARLLADGSILVSDLRAGEVKLFDHQGRFTKVVGGRGSGPGEFQFPGGPKPLGGDSVYGGPSSPSPW